MNTENEHLSFAARVDHVPKSFIREILKVAGQPGVVSFAGGLPNPSFFPVAELQECTNRAFRDYGAQLLQYAPTEGFRPLREMICQRYQQVYNMHIDPDEVLITNGSQQALDLIGKLFLNPGDTVLLERPTYLGALQCFSMFQPQFQQARLTEDGIDLNEAEEQLKEHHTRLAYCIPNFQNPTGLRYSLQKRKGLANLLAGYPTILIEDDPYGDICFTNERLPPLYSFLPDQTILLGTFSKTVAPGLRIGWMIARKEIIQKATILKQASDLHTANLPQYILHQFLCHYDLEKHIGKIQEGYKKQKDVMMDCLQEYFPSTVQHTKPEGGMFTWLTLPPEITARTFLQKASEKNILFVPGDTFYTSRPDTQTLRMNYSNVAEGRMRQAMQVLADILKEA